MQEIPKEAYEKIREAMYIQASFTLEAYLRQYRHMIKNSGKYSA